MKIEIDSDEVTSRSFQKDGKTFTFREQSAWLHLDGEKYPSSFRLQLGDSPAYPIGLYRLDARSFTIDRYNALVLKRSLVLIKA